MRSNPPNSRKRGFTLIEVVVALALAGGALALIMKANNASVSRGQAARIDLLVEREVETKLSEWRAGTLTESAGSLECLEGVRWEIREHDLGDPSMPNVVVVTLRVHGPARDPGFERVVLRLVSGGSR